MSGGGRGARLLSQMGITVPSKAEREPEPTHVAESDSIPVGAMRLSGIVKTTKGYAVASIELSKEEWAALAKKRLGASQRFKEHIATEHKSLVMKLGQVA